MTHARKLRPSPALVVATAALVLSVTGAAVALPGKGSVKSNDIAKQAVKTKNIAKGAVGSQQIKGKSIKGNRIKDGGIKAKQIADGAITGKQVAANGLDSSNIADFKTFSTELVTATDGASLAAARAAAPEQELFSKGPLTIYGKCIRDTTADELRAEVFVRTSQDGAVMDGDDQLNGDPAFLDVNTAEDLRQLEEGNAVLANAADVSEAEFMARAPDGTAISGQVATASKNGTLAGGNGIYGDGNVCLFNGQASG